MMDWFEWNGIRCTQYGIHVLEQPPVTIPSERVTFIAVPGRSGSLTQLEGDDVYDDMFAALGIVHRRKQPEEDAQVQKVYTTRRTETVSVSVYPTDRACEEKSVNR